MRGWTAEELDRIGAAEELQIAPVRPDRSLRRDTTIWVVRDGDDLYIRSYRGRAGVWFRAAQRHHEGRIRAGGVEQDVTFVEAMDPATNDAIDEAYRTKYRRYAASFVPPMVTAEARATTLKLVPRSTGA